MEIERIDYGDAIKQLSEDYRIDLTDFESKWQSSPEYKSDKEKQKRMMKLAQELFVSEIGNPKNIAVITYLKEKRRLSDSLIVQF
jgi:DNA primase